MGGDAQTLGVGIMTEARARATCDFLVGHGLLDPAKLDASAAFDSGFAAGAKVMPSP